jgi:sRNA-binding regulator protein Hfq
MDAANRRLIRPPLVEAKEHTNLQRRNNNHQKNKKNIPLDQTNAENFYYLKQMQARTPMVIVLQDGETIEGIIEWYDRGSLKIHRDGKPNLLVYKPSIKYMYKALG